MSQKKHLDTLLEIKDNPSTNQRTLAKKLNISLGLTNAILKNLVVRGWIKAKKDTGRKLLYIITPKGMAKVSGLMYQKFQETFHYYHYTKEFIAKYLMNLYKKGARTVSIYGFSHLTEITYYAGMSTPLKLEAVIDDNASKEKYLKHPVVTVEKYLSKYSTGDKNNAGQPIIILSTVNPGKLTKKIEKYEKLKNRIKIIEIERILTHEK